MKDPVSLVNVISPPKEDSLTQHLHGLAVFMAFSGLGGALVSIVVNTTVGQQGAGQGCNILTNNFDYQDL
jgi:hypothetical protein